MKELIYNQELELQYKWGLLKVSGTIDGYEIKNINLAPRKEEDRMISINKRIRDAIKFNMH